MKSFLVPIIRRHAYGMMLRRPQLATIYTTAFDTRSAQKKVLAVNPDWEIDSRIRVTQEKEGDSL